MLLLALLLACPTTGKAKQHSGPKPQWVSKGVANLNSKRSNDTYYFRAIQNEGRDLQVLKDSRIQHLSEYISQQHHFTGKATTEILNQQEGQSARSSVNFRMVFQDESQSVTFDAVLVDEYWEAISSGNYRYYALFAVSDKGDKACFDEFSTTRTYGALPALMSVVPGVGQLYKGSKVKGFTMLGGAALCTAAIVYCDNLRASYVTKMHEQPRHAQTYKSKADNYETARNVAIGVTGALVVYSIVDAAVAPGVTRIKVRPGTQLNLRPTALATPTGLGLGVSVACNF